MPREQLRIAHRGAELFRGQGDLRCSPGAAPHEWQVVVRISQGEAPEYRQLGADCTRLALEVSGEGHASAVVEGVELAAGGVGRVMLQGVGFCPFKAH